MQTSQISSELEKADIVRYGRQLILQEFGIECQAKLKKSSVLVVGVGGIGCPLALSLVCSGIGRIGLVDYDAVEVTNLHRQILHSESRIGKSKVESAAIALREHQSNCSIETINQWICIDNVLELIQNFDIICDASDNVSTRYLLNDACRRKNKSLVSASALGWEGQIVTFLSSKDDLPCYRCLFPIPPSSEYVLRCSDGGVLGPITSIIGTLQALEVINLLKGVPNYSQKMLYFDGRTAASRLIPLRKKKPDCMGCSTPFSPISCILDESCYISSENLGYKELSVLELSSNSISNLVIIDVRPIHHFEICSLKDSINIPANVLLKMKTSAELPSIIPQSTNICILCRRGVDSIGVANHLLRLSNQLTIFNVTGGLVEWAKQVDPDFPIY